MAIVDRLQQMHTPSLDIASMAVIDRLQSIEDPAKRLFVLALMLNQFCRLLGINPKRVMEIADRAVAHAENNDTAEARAFRDYIRKEMR